MSDKDGLAKSREGAGLPGSVGAGPRQAYSKRDSARGRNAMLGSERAAWCTVAAVSGFLAVGAGAFGAHAVESGSRAQQLLTTGAIWQLLHAVALLASLALAPSRAVGICFTLGLVAFPGALYALAWDGPRWLGAVAPLGGAAFLAGWLLVAVAAWRKRGI
jgi:uncharacterized membrane protein YgdD (TMEM256/DUF423 family)